MDAVKQFLEFVDRQQGITLPPWVAHIDGTRDMVRQGEHNDCGLATCYIIEAVAQNVALSHFTVEGIYQAELALLSASLPSQFLQSQPLWDLLFSRSSVQL
jgi:hypothetical protein